MNTWRALSEIELAALLSDAAAGMTDKEKRYWEAVKIPPEKWEEETYGAQGGGFWAVGLLGKSVLWYNDIEDGFNVSSFSKYGRIDEYWANQDDLLPLIRRFAFYLEQGKA